MDRYIILIQMCGQTDGQAKREEQTSGNYDINKYPYMCHSELEFVFYIQKSCHFFDVGGISLMFGGCDLLILALVMCDE